MARMLSNNSFSNQERQQLLQLARHSIDHGLDTGRPVSVASQPRTDTFSSRRASFVTLTLNTRLRGCIGSLEARRALVHDIAENAFAAAFKDYRFSPLTRHEYDQIKISLSILSPKTALVFTSESDLLEQLQPGTDGLVIEHDSYRGTFLPSVWSSLPEPQQFLQQLKQKAGLPADFWSERIKVFRYTAEYIE